MVARVFGDNIYYRTEMRDSPVYLRKEFTCRDGAGATFLAAVCNVAAARAWDQRPEKSTTGGNAVCCM